MSELGSVCLLCPTVLSPEIDSKEHIIPNSIGGRAKVMGFLCRDCNNARGRTWESVLANQFTEFSLFYGIVREDGETPATVVSTTDGEKLLWRNDGTMTVERPSYTEEELGGGHRISIIGRTESDGQRRAQEVRCG